MGKVISFQNRKTAEEAAKQRISEFESRSNVQNEIYYMAKRICEVLSGCYTLASAVELIRYRTIEENKSLQEIKELYYISN